MAHALVATMTASKKQILRVGASGLMATLIDLVLLLVLVEWARAPVVVAVFLSTCTGAAVGFVIAKFWAFRDSSPIRIAQISLFAVVALGSALGVSASVHLFSVVLGMSYLLAKAVGAAIVFIGWSYPMQSRVVFCIRC